MISRATQTWPAETTHDLPRFDILSQIIAKLGDLMIEAEALLMDIRVLQFNLERKWVYQFVAMSACGLLIGASIGCAIMFHVLR